MVLRLNTQREERKVKLSEVQKEAVDFYEGCCNVIASAGSGKTRVLVNRIANLIEKYDVEPQHILAITFSKKAKENMADRLKKMIPDYAGHLHIETFHSFGFRMIRQFEREDYEILDQDWKKVKIIEEILHQRFRIKEPDGQEIADILHYISVQKNQMKKPDRSRMGKIYAQYEDYKDENHLLDFDDMLTKCYEILTTNQRALDYCQDKYRFILADEMQDTNAVQYAILKLIGERYKNIFVVDDPLQNIFMWRGSDNKYVLEFDNDWEGARTIQLNKNYRSSSDIVAAANKFAKCIPESQHKHYIESVADKGEFEKPHFAKYYDETDEAQRITELIKGYAKDGYAYKDIAVLTRTNAQLQYFEAALYRGEVPYTVVDGVSFIDRREIKIVLSYLRLAADINDDEAFEYIYNRPNRWLSGAFLQECKRVARKEKISLYCAMFKISKTNWKYRNGVNSIHAAVKQVGEMDYKSVTELIKGLRVCLNLDSYVSKDLCDDDDSRIENLNTLERMASNYNDVKRFISFMTRFGKEKKNEPDSVQLMTIHKAKGLEFPIVFVAGVNDGVLPHRKNENVNEEKRLMYVAMTRAEQILNISSTERFGGDEAKVSEFINAIF